MPRAAPRRITRPLRSRDEVRTHHPLMFLTLDPAFALKPPRDMQLMHPYGSQSPRSHFLISSLPSRPVLVQPLGHAHLKLRLAKFVAQLRRAARLRRTRTCMLPTELRRQHHLVVLYKPCDASHSFESVIDSIETRAKSADTFCEPHRVRRTPVCTILHGNSVQLALCASLKGKKARVVGEWRTAEQAGTFYTACTRTKRLVKQHSAGVMGQKIKTYARGPSRGDGRTEEIFKECLI